MKGVLGVQHFVSAPSADHQSDCRGYPHILKAEWLLTALLISKLSLNHGKDIYRL